MPQEMDAKEFKELLLSLYSTMFSVAKQMLSGNDDDAKDALQETATALWSKRRLLAEAANKQAYTLAALRRTCIDKIRAAKPHEEIEQVGDLCTESEEFEAQQTITAMLRLLPDRQALIVRLRDIDGLEFDEIAARTSLSEANIRQLLSRGRRKLRELYSNGI